MRGRKPPTDAGPARPRLYDRVKMFNTTWAPMPVIVADALTRPGADTAPRQLDEAGVVIPPFPECFIEAETVTPSGAVTQRGVYAQDISAQIHTDEFQYGHPIPPGTRWTMLMCGFQWSQDQL